MPKQFDDMVDAMKKSLRKQYPNMSEDKISSKAYAMATANWKKSHGGKLPSEKISDWHVLEFYVPIDNVEENIKEGLSDDFVIKGVAINETTTLNNVKYVAEELQKAASTFRNVPVLLDHKNEVKNIVGRTTERVDFNPNFKRIDYEAKIMDKEIREMIKDGRIQSVSIGAKVDDLIEEEDGSMKAIGIKGLEISLVAVPGDNHASLAQALQHNFCLKEMAMLDEVNECDEKLKKEDNKMSEEIQKSEEKAEVQVAETSIKEEIKAEEKVEAIKELSKETSEKSTDINTTLINSEMDVMKKQITEIKELLMEKKKLKEKMETEEKQKVEDKTVGEISEDKKTLEKLDNMIVEKASKGYAIFRDYTQEGTDSKLKRLIR